jgi:hypothetical protein
LCCHWKHIEPPMLPCQHLFLTFFHFFVAIGRNIP